MAHYSEMDFLFSSTPNREAISQQLNNTSRGNTQHLFRGQNDNDYDINNFDETKIVNDTTLEDGTNIKEQSIYNKKENTWYTNTNNHVSLGKVAKIYYKGNNHGTKEIKNYLVNGNNQRSGIYKNENNTQNPYIKLLNDFNVKSGQPGSSLTIKAADLVYLKDLGVYPINRMAILRRFPEGSFVKEDLEEMRISPISTIIGWLKPDQNFGDISFNETWSRTNKRFDVLVKEIIDKIFKIDISQLIPIPDFAQGVVFELYKRIGLTSGDENGIDDNEDDNWGLNNIPVGDPNVLQEGPFKNPEGQNLQSSFSFELTTTYEQKFIGDVDPGSAMLDILDNIFTMGTSNMVFYWSEKSPIIKDAIKAVDSKANNLNAWWDLVSGIMIKFWDVINDLFKQVGQTVSDVLNLATSGDVDGLKKAYELAKQLTIKAVTATIQTILTSTIAIYRFELRGSIELMTGGKNSSTPWHLTIGNPYSPWLSTNHIIVKSATISTSTELTYNDMPQWVTAKFMCEFSRSLGKQELLRMFNNSYRRTYSTKLIYQPDDIKNNVNQNSNNNENNNTQVQNSLPNPYYNYSQNDGLR